jgi:hypothetical protein
VGDIGTDSEGRNKDQRLWVEKRGERGEKETESGETKEQTNRGRERGRDKGRRHR